MALVMYLLLAFGAGMIIGARLAARAEQQSEAAYRASVDCLATMMKADACHKVTGMRRVM